MLGPGLPRGVTGALRLLSTGGGTNRSQEGIAFGRGSIADHLQKPGLVQNPDPQLLRLLKLGSRLVAGNDIIGLFANTAAHLSTQGLDFGRSLLAFERRQRDRKSVV